MDKNQLYFGDNLDVPRAYIKDESVDLVYLDPSFNSSRNYSVIFSRSSGGGNGNGDRAQIEAFEDTWHWTPSLISNSGSSRAQPGCRRSDRVPHPLSAGEWSRWA
jgi:hypothetical protein